jgi:hypothetical protein
VLLKIEVFFDMMLCHWALHCQNFEESWCLHLEGMSVLNCLTKNVKALLQFKTSGTTHLTAQNHIPEDLIPHFFSS